MPSSSARAAACIGPAPPNGIRAKRRGSTPRSTVTTRSARTISWFATLTIPSAVSSSPSPSAAPSRSTASRAASTSSSTPPASVEAGVQVAEQEVGVGDRGLGAAAAVAGGPGVRPGRLRPGAKRAARVEPADRAAAGPDGVDVDHRQLDHPAADLARVGAPHPAVLDHADVARGAAHVEPDRVPVRGERRQQAGADRAAGGAREHAPGSRPGGLRGGRHAAGGPHHQRLRQAALGAGRGEPPQVAAEQGRQVGVDDGGRAALVLAKLRQHLVRDRDVEARELGAQALGDRALVSGVEVGEQQADGHRLGLAGPREGRHPIQLSLRERRDHALGACALPGGEAELVGHQRGRLRRAEPVEVGAVLASDLEQVGEALGGDQGRARAALLEQGVGAHGHAVGKRLDLVRAGARPPKRRLDRGEHAPRLVVRGGRRLRRVQGAPVEEHGVGERPADVDSEQHRRNLLRWAIARIARRRVQRPGQATTPAAGPGSSPARFPC